MSLISTYLQDIRAKYPNRIDSQEWRFTRYGFLGAVVEMTESEDSIVDEDLKEKAMNSEGRTLDIPVMSIGDDIVIKNQRSCTIGDLENTTGLVTVNWMTLVADISMLPAQYKKNEVKYASDLGKKIAKVDNAFCKAVEDMINTRLETEKSGIYNSTMVGTDYPIVGNALQVGVAQQEFFFNDLEVIINEDDFYQDNDRFKVLSSTGMKAPVNKYTNQGEQNDLNTRYQFGAFDFRFSNHHAVGAGIKSSGFVVPNGSIGIVSRIAVDSQMEHETTNGDQWSTDKLPKFPFEVGTFYKSTCFDASGTAGLEHLNGTKKENWQLSVDIGLITSYNSDPANKTGAIKKFEFA